MAKRDGETSFRSPEGSGMDQLSALPLGAQPGIGCLSTDPINGKVMPMAFSLSLPKG